MPHLDQKDCFLTAQYRFINCLSWTSIAARIDGATAHQIHNFCAQLKTKHPNTSPNKLMNIAGQKKRRGDIRCVKPGSNTSLKIREILQGSHAWHSQVETANYILHQMRRNDAKEPLKELSNKQVYNICMDEAHCKQDPSNSCPLLRKQALEKLSLEKLDLPDREWYINKILRLSPQNTLLICADETPITFGGSQHRRVTAPRGVAVYVGMEKPYFIHMQ